MVMDVRTISFNQLPNLEKSACCIGYFDGLHKGHQQLIKKAKQEAKDNHLLSGMITFHPDPWTLFHPEKPLTHLCTLDDKMELARSMQLDVFYILEFSKEFASLSVDQFHQVLKDMHIVSLVCGFDFQYGTKNSGNIQSLLSQKDFKVSVIDSVNDKEEKISSSRIEPCIEKGDMECANELLGYPYSISGTIGHGYRRGTNLLEIPTANLDYNEEYVLPQVGVYAGFILLDQMIYPTMINVGNNPTFGNHELSIEAHILDFNQNIYDKPARYFFLEKIRDEIQFDHFEQLKDQLHQDIQTSKMALSKYQKQKEQIHSIWIKNNFQEE